MNKYSSLFSQMLSIFQRHTFDRIVKDHQAERHARGFRSWSHFVSMLFCQVGKANTLSEISNGLATCEGKLVHLGIEAPKKSTLAYANAHRPWEMFRDLFFDLLGRCQSEAAKHKRKFRFKHKLYSIDSSTVDLCLSKFDWAKFRRTKGAIKLHLQLDHDGYLPVDGCVTEGNVHDVRIVDRLNFEEESIYVFDKGYTDYRFYGSLCERGAYFVTRMKKNADYRVMERRPVVEGSGVHCDQIIELTGFYAEKHCPHRLRRIHFYDKKEKRTLVFITNNMTLAASTIARIYKERWEVELFFKALKQNLKIKTFVGTSANAVKIQIWTALIAILLLKYLQLKSTFRWALSNLAALLRMNLFTHRDLWAWIDKPFSTMPLEIDSEQLCLSLG